MSTIQLAAQSVVTEMNVHGFTNPPILRIVIMIAQLERFHNEGHEVIIQTSAYLILLTVVWFLPLVLD
ncbi:hypothetical protein JCM16418A_36970 [Paenibacillus pini]